MKLHLGCGKRHIPGWVHVDLDTYPHIDHYHDIRTLPFLGDASAEVIYSCHALEYFDRFEVQKVLAEWRRVLKPGGVLRTAVPDFEGLVKVYQKSGDLDRVLGPMYGRIAVKTSKGDEVFFHKTVYDFTGLKRVLEECGFGSVHRYDWRTTEHASVDDFSAAYFPHMDQKNGIHISLNVEATKI